MLNLLQNFISDREKQLKIQKQIDSKLIILKDKCPNVLIQFFLREREINRIQCENVRNTSIWEYSQVLTQNILEIDKRNSELLKIIESDNICKNLLKFNSFYCKILK